jgi:hypothetical protein
VDKTAKRTQSVAHPRPYVASDLRSICELDRAATGANRRCLLERLVAGAGAATASVFASGSALSGYVLSRPGSQATQVGPCIARTRQAGQALLTEALWRLAGQMVYVDIPAQQPAAVAVAEAAGLEPLRQLERMCRGAESCEQMAWLWASSGPEKG